MARETWVQSRVIPKTQKMVLDASLLNTQHYKVRIKGKVEQSREGVAPSPTPWCSSYRKGSLRVTLDYGRHMAKLRWIPAPIPTNLQVAISQSVLKCNAMYHRIMIFEWKFLFWLGLVWWYIIYYWLFNAKSIFIYTNSYITNNSV